MNKLVTLAIQFVTPVVLVALYFFFVLELDTSYLLTIGLFSLGLLFGILLMFLDAKWLHTYYEDRPGKFITRSLLFLLAYPALGIFVTTSSGSALGQGLILGMGSTLLAEMYQYAISVPAFSDRFLWQLKKPVTAKDVRTILYLSVGVYFLLVYLVLR